MKKLLQIFLLLGGIALLQISMTSCSTPKFTAISPTPVLRGTGGSPKNVDGVEFWQDGTPAKKYKVLGYVNEWWRGPALDDFDFRHLAPVVKSSGGDAGIVIRGDKPAPGLVRQSDEVGDDVLRLQIIKFQ